MGNIGLMKEHIADTPVERRFHEATEALYVCFGEYPKPPVEHCLDPLETPVPEYVRLAWEKSLREYDEHDLEHLVHHCLCGGHVSREDLARELKFWLPRLLDEMTSRSPAPHSCEDWFIAEYMRSAGWHDWPRSERSAICRWCERWLEACMLYPCGQADKWWGMTPGGRGIGLWIEFTTQIELDLVSHFDRLTTNPDLEVIRTMCQVISDLAPQLMQWHELGEVDFPTATVDRSFLAWLLQPDLGTRLEAAFFRWADDNRWAAKDISEAIGFLPVLRNSWLSRPGGPPDWLRDAPVKAG